MRVRGGQQSRTGSAVGAGRSRDLGARRRLAPGTIVSRHSFFSSLSAGSGVPAPRPQIFSACERWHPPGQHGQQAQLLVFSVRAVASPAPPRSSTTSCLLYLRAVASSGTTASKYLFSCTSAGDGDSRHKHHQTRFLGIAVR